MVVVFHKEHEKPFELFLLLTSGQDDCLHLIAEFTHEVTEDGDSEQEIEGNDDAFVVRDRIQVTKANCAERRQLVVSTCNHFVRRTDMQQVPGCVIVQK